MINIQNQNFGVEIELTGITRNEAAKVIANHYGTGRVESGYDYYNSRYAFDTKGRKWRCMSDASITCQKKVNGNTVSASSEYSCEVVTPILQYDDLNDLQEIVRELRAAGGRLAEELARRELEDADDEALGALAGLGDDGDEVVVGVLGEERLLGDGPRGDDAGDLAADHAAALDALRVLHLVADGGLEAGADDLGEVGVEGVVRDAAHRLAGAVGEGEAEEGGGAAGVVHEELVEIPEAEEEQRVAVQVLPHRAVLAQHRGEFFGHFRGAPLGAERGAQSSRTAGPFQSKTRLPGPGRAW